MTPARTARPPTRRPRTKTNDPSSATVSVRLGKRTYPIEIGYGTLAHFGHRLSLLRPTHIGAKVAVVTHPSLVKLYGRSMVLSLREAGFAVTQIVIPQGESSKDLAWLGRIIDTLVAEKFERNSALIALGGGVIGDLTGFAASVYLRGVPYVQVPTTVIAQVDSSVGGKTAVNHAQGKNLIGAFYQPKLVVIDIATLNSLDRRECVGGLAEVIKYGVIADAALFSFLEANMERVLNRDPDVWRHLVKRSCEIKAAVVSADEREGGRRRILNYGHTLGHAIEAVTGYRGYTHGEAVAMGMDFAAELSVARGTCSRTTWQRQRDVCRRAGLPSGVSGLSAAAMMRAMERDKKVVAEIINFVLVDRIGRVRIEPIEKPVLRQMLNTVTGAKRRRHDGSLREGA